jgi:hypothetical protein
MNIIIKVLMFVPNRILKYADSLNTVLMTPTMIKDGTAKSFDQITKLFGATTGAVGAGKGLADAREAFLCADGLCFVVSCVGVAADNLQMAASFVPGPNVTVVVTMPISLGCKTFVWCCKRGIFPNGKC